MKLAAAKQCSNPQCDGSGAASKKSDAGGGGGGVVVALSRCPCHHAAYCCISCQKDHWLEHKEFCKVKRAEMLEIAALEARGKEKEGVAALSESFGEASLSTSLGEGEGGDGEEEEEEDEEEEDEDEEEGEEWGGGIEGEDEEVKTKEGGGEKATTSLPEVQK